MYGHIEKSSLPIGGKTTHCVLTGHTGFIKAEIFTRLNEMQFGDEVYLNTLNEKLKYEVYNIKIVLPNEVDDLKICEGKDLLTLVTCTPYGVNTHRLLVQCKRKENEEQQLNQEKTYETNTKHTNLKYYFRGFLFGIIMFLLCIICCILLNIIVKYIKKVRKRK